MYIPNDDKNKLVERMSRDGAYAVSMLSEASQGEASHPNTYSAGYMQGYAHAIDNACWIVSHCDEIP